MRLLRTRAQRRKMILSLLFLKRMKSSPSCLYGTSMLTVKYFNFEHEKEDLAQEYLLRFELLESKLRNRKAGISNMFLANALFLSEAI